MPFKILVMPNPQSNQNPEGLNAAWKVVHNLEKDIAGIKEILDHQTVWRKVWAERTWIIPTATGVLVSLVGGIWFIGGLILDSHIQKFLEPTNTKIIQLQTDVAGIRGELQRLAIVEAEVHVLTLQKAAEKPSDPNSAKESSRVLKRPGRVA